MLPTGATSDSSRPGNAVLAKAVDIELGVREATKTDLKLPDLSGSVVTAALEQVGESQAAVGLRAAAAPEAQAVQQAQAGRSAAQGGDDDDNGRAGTVGCSNVFTGGGAPKNIRVNQDCSLRRQAEEVVAVNPTNPRNLVAGQNDSVVGFNHCGYDFSFDGGKTWGTLTPPFYQFTGVAGHTFDACSDPTATFDANGNAYVGGVLFDLGTPHSAFLVMKSNAPNGGAFYHEPRSIAFQLYRTTVPGVVANDNNPDVFHDKEFIVADSNPGSPKKNNVYATWTRFANTGVGVGGNSPIYFSQSTDGGATWSPGIEISGANAAICTAFSGSANPKACDQDQGSHPYVGRDGTLYVAFGNSNTPLLGINQVLVVKCAAAANCASAASWSAPVKVGDLIGTHPTGPDANGCPAGRQCLPPNGYRVPEFTSISNSVDRNGVWYVSWADSRNLGANCNPLGLSATATPPCDNDVFYAYSTNGGTSWSPAKKLTPAPSAQWQPWSEVTSDGDSLWVAYYDRSYGSCETTGCNDITAVEVRNPTSSKPKLKYTRVTTSSMPNLTPATNPVQAGFLGDYMWVDVHGEDVHIVWADTRPRVGTAPEEDVYYARLGGGDD